MQSKVPLFSFPFLEYSTIVALSHYCFSVYVFTILVFIFRIFGSYLALETGFSHEALVDMTGGIGEFIDVHTIQDRSKFFKMIKRVFKRGSLICSAINVISIELAMYILSELLFNAFNSQAFNLSRHLMTTPLKLSLKMA